MAFSFGNGPGAANQATAEGSVQGPDLETIQTEALGFHSIAGDAKVRLTSAWTTLPSPTSSLLSVAPRKGLVAAAGPDQIVVASTEAVRKAFEAPKNDDSDIRGFEPQLKLPMSMRVSQVAFTADEEYLLLSAEEGGGIAAYEVSKLQQGANSSSFELSTDGDGLRAMIPNPTPEKAELCAVVTDKGRLHMANLKERKISGVLKDNVSCVSWSSKGKQLCAGQGDGSISQMTPEGVGKATIPSPPGSGDCHVSCLTWLENHLFLAIHTANNASTLTSTYSLITRQPPSSFTYQKLADPVEPFGSEKTPHHSVLRLRDFPPDLQDLLLISSTASTEIGLLSRSKRPLATDKSAESITSVFTTTELLDDTRRPTLPMTDSMDDSTPIGVSLDLSAKEKVYKPIPTEDELDESPGPLPALWVLTHEGILCAWWVIYSDAVKQGVSYPALSALQDTNTQPQSQASAQSPFGNTSAAAPSPFGNAAATSSPFASTGASAFGSKSSGSAFGAPTQMGQNKSPWSTPTTGGTAAATGTAFGQSSFGTSSSPAAPAFGSTGGPAFGQSAQLGQQKSSPWGGGGSSGPAFGQSAFSGFANQGANNASPFGSTGANVNQSGGSGTSFAGFANKGGFGSIAGSNSGSSIFGSGNKSGSPFGGSSSTSQTAFPPPSEAKSSGANPFGSQPFKLTSSFKPDTSDKDGSQQNPGGSMFGSTFGSALKDAKDSEATEASAAKDQDMDVGGSGAVTPQPKQPSLLSPQKQQEESTTPTSTPGPSLLAASPKSTTPGTSLFGQPTKLGNTDSPFATSPTPPNWQKGGAWGSQGNTATAEGSGGLFGSSKGGQPSSSGFFGKDTKSTDTTSKAGQPTEEVPLPPDTTTPSTSLDTTNLPSKPEAAPLPPDFTVSTTPSKQETAPLPPDFTESVTPTKPDAAPLPPDFVASTTPKTPAAGGIVPFASETPKIKEEPVDEPPSTSKTPLFGGKAPNKGSTTSKSSQQSRSIFDAPMPSTNSTSNPFAKFTTAAGYKMPDSQSEDSDSAGSAEEEPDSGEDAGEGELSGSDGEGAEGTDEHEGSEEEEVNDGSEDEVTEGSGIDVAKDFSPTVSGFSSMTPNITPQHSFGGSQAQSGFGTQKQQTTASKPLFGELGRNAPLFPKPAEVGPRSPSPIRSAVPSRVLRSDTPRSVSAPGMASNLLGPKQSQRGGSNVQSSAAPPFYGGDSMLMQQQRLKERQEAAEKQPLVDEEDDDIQKILASEVKGTLALDEFIAHSNAAPPAKDSIPAQVEAVYRDINSMIDTLGLNARAVKSFTKGHNEYAAANKSQSDLEDAEGWILCEVDALGEVLDNELAADLEDSRVQDLDGKLEVIRGLAREMQRLRAKQDDLGRLISHRMDPDQEDKTRNLPLSAEQATQQSEFRREFATVTKLLSEVEEALTLLKTKIASLAAASGQIGSQTPTVEAIMRTIAKMTSMAEKRSGDVDVLENQLRKMRLGTPSREGSPMLMTPRGRRSIMFSPESTPSRNLRHSLSGSISLGAAPKATPPRKKLSGFSMEEKSALMERRARKKIVLNKLKDVVEKKGVNVWTLQEGLEG